MQLPFTREQFFDLFIEYNEALWPGVAGLWIASAICVWKFLERRPVDRWIAALLAWHWAWSGLAYHVAFFTRINPAAWIFAALSLVQAVLFFRVGVLGRRLSFAPWHTAWAPVAWGLIVYSLAYPAINAVSHHTLSRIPVFGVPCPTTIFTAGMLMLATPRSWRLSIVPVIWSAIGGSAAFLLGVHADLALPVAGVALAIYTASIRRPERRHFGRAFAPARAVGIWLMLMAVETVHGVFRRVVLEPQLGDLPARQLSVFTGAVLIVVVLWLTLPWLGPQSGRRWWELGLLWVTLTLAFEIALGRAAGMSWERITSDFDPHRGGLLGFGMMVILVAPRVLAGRRGLRPGSADSTPLKTLSMTTEREPQA
jgi:hypothetical protein